MAKYRIRLHLGTFYVERLELGEWCPMKDPRGFSEGFNYNLLPNAYYPDGSSARDYFFWMKATIQNKSIHWETLLFTQKIIHEDEF